MGPITTSCLLLLAITHVSSTLITLSEEQNAGTTIVDLPEILESPMSKNSGAKFKILMQELKTPSRRPPPPGTKFIGVSPMGVVKQLYKWDREALCGKSPDCLIESKIVMIPEKSVLRWVTLRIRINDVNDHDPQFPSPVVDLEISETDKVGHVTNLDRFQATDKDLGNNSLLTYSLEPPSKFFKLVHTVLSSGLSHLELELIKQLDYESIRVHRINLVASDNGAPVRSSSIQLLVHVVDANDNEPVFEKEVYDVTLKEDTEPGSVIERVVATDLESEFIRYSVKSSSGDVINGDVINGDVSNKKRWPIAVDEKSGFVTLREKLDRERHDGLRVLIEAEDGDPEKPRSSKCVLILHVEDVNDNAPEININFITESRNDTAYVSEDAPVSTYLAHVSALDRDEGKYGDVTMTVETIVPATKGGQNMTEIGYFSINDANLLSTDVPFDREKRDLYDVIITACDGGIPAKCSSAHIAVVILDVNEYPPIFQHPDVSLRLSEETEVGSVIAVAKATDRDSINLPAWRQNGDKVIEESLNGEVYYSLSLSTIQDPSNLQPPIMVDPTSGKITLIRHLDYEERSKWEFTIFARDGGHPTSLESRRKLTIVVSDVNDNPPIFSSPPHDNATIYASMIKMEEDGLFYQLKGLDFDRQDTTTGLKYFIKVISKDGSRTRHQRSSDLFRLDPSSGELRLRVRDVTKRSDILGLYKTTIKVSDSGIPPMTSSLTMYIDVIDTLPPVQPRVSRGSEKAPAQGSTTLLLAVILGGAAVLIILCVVVVTLLVRRKKKKRAGKVVVKEVEAKKSDDEENVSLKTRISSKSSPPVSPAATRRDSRVNDLCVHTVNRSASDRRRRASAHASIDQNCQVCDAPNSPGSMQRFINQQQANYASQQNPLLPHGRRQSSPEKITTERLYSSSAFPVTYQRRPSTFDPASMGEQCTDMCKMYGHSDTCWMPSNGDIITSEPASPTEPKWPGKYAPKRKDSGCSVDTNSSAVSYYKMSRERNNRHTVSHPDPQLPDVVARGRHVTSSDVSSLMSSTNSSGASSGRVTSRFSSFHHQRSPERRGVKKSNSDSGYDVSSFPPGRDVTSPSTEC